MFDEKFKIEVFELAKSFGFEQFELYYESGKSLSISTYEGEIEEFNENKVGGINFRGILNGKLGSSFSETIDETTAKYLVENAKNIAEIIEDDDEIIFHDGSGEYVDLNLYTDSISEVSIEDKIAYVLDLDKKAHQLANIEKVLDVAYSDADYEARIVNSLGLDKYVKSNFMYAVVGLSANDGTNSYTEYEDKVANSFEELKQTDLTKIVSENLFKKLNSKPIKSAKYKCVFRNDAFSSLLSAYMGSFSARSCQKGFSKLVDKIDKKIASSCVTIIDDPHIAGANGSESFDAEGVATYKKTIVDKGILKTYFHNLITAKVDGVKSTGNASRSFKSLVGISPSNTYIQAGECTYNDLIEKIDKGVIITELEGMHAGVDGLSGDFSLKCAGFYVEDKKMTPINQIVVSSNFFEVLLNIECIADDLDVLKSRISSPSVYVGEIAIAGL